MARTQNPRGAGRGSSNPRRGGVRPDRDGDLKMDTASRRRGGRIAKPTPPGERNKDLTSRIAPKGGAKTSILSGTARSAILRQVAAGDIAMKGVQSRIPRRSLEELRITGWVHSKASADTDGGINSLIKWLEKKASHRLGSRAREVKIKKVCSTTVWPVIRDLYPGHVAPADDFSITDSADGEK